MAGFIGKKFVQTCILDALEYMKAGKNASARRRLLTALKKLNGNGRKGRKTYKSGVDKRPLPPLI